ncbi:hypothetical protein SAMN05192534_105147 [Alteribacillus persepolensis]|uniref:YfhS protein n=1 Tax=Alteribacillus persepolensis TaxID=568899 RepID=A0A1G8CDK6_9BACI|nr:cytosolic protein [Alteribacillus persepolensis]SDH43439.1 hypothetical protein SAMN05192534_105147 [Alteribacillus persepolensis]
MYVGRDFSELLMTSKKNWTDKELAHFHESFQQILPYLTSEGGMIYREILQEMRNRQTLYHNVASYERGTSIHPD